LTTNEENPNEWVDVEALKNELNELDKNRDIWVPEPGYQSEKKEDKDDGIVEIEVDASGNNEAQFDWEDDGEGLVVKGEGQSDEEFNKEVQEIANNELDADEAYIRMYQEMLKEGRRDGDDPLKKDVALNSILNMLLEQSETGTKTFENFIKDRQIKSFEDVFFEILAQGNSIIRDTSNPEEENEVRMLMNILQRYKEFRGEGHRSLKEMDSKTRHFREQFSCGIDSHKTCRKLEEESQTDTDADGAEKTEDENKPEETEETLFEEEKVIIDETKDLQKGIKWLLTYIPTDVDNESLREIGTGLIDSSIEKIQKYEKEFEEKGNKKSEEEMEHIKTILNTGKNLKEPELFNYIQQIKKNLNNKIDFLLTEEERDKEATALARMEDTLKKFDETLKTHEGSIEKGAEEVLVLDKEVEEKLESIKNQLKSQKKSDKGDWKVFRKNIKELINYELSNVKRNEATKKINNISKSVQNILDNLGSEIQKGTLQNTVKETSGNLIEDLQNLKNDSKMSGLIIDADQYKKIVKEMFNPVKELLDDSGRARIEINKSKFDKALKSVENFVHKVPNKIPHANPEKELKRFKWIQKDLPANSNLKPEDEDKKKVKYENGLRYELVEIKKVTPDYLDSAEGLVMELENGGQDTFKEFRKFINSVAFKNKMTKILDRLQNAYFVANEESGSILQDTNVITRLKQGYYLHKPVARMLRSLILARNFFDEKDVIAKKIKARKLGIKATVGPSMNQRDADMMLYLQTRLAHSIKHEFKAKTLERAYQSLVNEKH
jgi:hypothetical protein